MKNNYTTKHHWLTTLLLLSSFYFATAQVTDSELQFDGTNDIASAGSVPALEGSYTFECYARVNAFNP
jgi:hypothetical protein